MEITAEETQDGVQHEPERKLLGQCPDGALLPESEEALRDVVDYLLMFYKQKRLNSALDNMSPAEFERQCQAQTCTVQA